MSGKTTHRAGVFALFLLLTALVAGGAGWFAWRAALEQLAARGQADLSLASDRLVGQLQRFRQVAVIMADHPDLVALAKGQGGSDRASGLLLATADKIGAVDLLLAGLDGAVLASSQGTTGGSVSDQPHFRRAMHGALGTTHSRLAGSNRRVFQFAAPIIESDKILGAVVVVVDMEAIEESDWRGDPNAVFFTDQDGVIFVANRSELVLRTRGTGGFAPDRVRMFGDFEVWSVSSGPYIPRRALHLTQPLPIIGMTGEVLVSTAPAERLALLQAAAVAAVLLAFGAILFWVTERRRALADRLEIEARAKAELETRVQERTAELKQAQVELVQAGKLSALGQMSAGISHELNQPLMAIRSFAENAEQFLQRGKVDVAGRNLNRISELARRMGRIISNFRAFAKQESEPITDVDIVAVVEAVLEMSEARFVQDKVEVVWQAPPAPVYVRGGEVRLQQVLVNLISNAIDAMEGSVLRRIEIAVETGDRKARLRVRDTGPGIAAPEKIFEPYYTTKAVGKADGLGLGLSISYGLVQSFGGDIRGRNHPDGGAVFTVELARAGMEKAA
ncbi:sensor histidine kinase [Profundibacter amoris]|uniref:C4-dicarboxylate transport sensor protein DctB n=1 Tax=Profundibacter amoris TaxID=2171755 RepID=A0A347ULH4_9RHOB|nr:ATP-binding protein [Profundibacter amoris]AXX99702.1 sensor histidine kinase [Profundibacter amoris]